MELPKRAKQDRYVRPGEYGRLEARLRRYATDTSILFVYAFDHRTRLGPFLFLDKMLIPGAPIAVGAALHGAGFGHVRLVLQQWNRNIRPSRARLNGRVPDILMVSSMHCHSGAAYGLIRDAWQLGDQRPLIMAGGSKAIYEPWDFFGLSQEGSVGADVSCTGEQFVLLALLDRIFEHKSASETPRHAFERLRRENHLDDIPGLVYRGDDGRGPPRYLVNTGIQRLVQDLDELPLPFASLDLFEPAHPHHTLRVAPLPVARLGRQAKIIAIVTTHGCKFNCSYCPIPAYNQRSFRHKSPERTVAEISGLMTRTGIRRYFGTDDNFFNHRETVESVLTEMAHGSVNGKPFRDAIDFSTEATQFDVLKNRDLIPLARDAGLRQIWFGVEDMTAELIKKGQSPAKTLQLFRLLTSHGIAPNPMLMHHDAQPLWTRGSLYGLLNQARYLRRAGAASLQATFLTPSPGSSAYEQPFRDGLVFGRVGGRKVDDYLYDGNHIVASKARQPWRKQWNLTVAYAYFYNPLHLMVAALRFGELWEYYFSHQLLGNLRHFRSLYQDRGWLYRLMTGPIERQHDAPGPACPMVVPEPTDLSLTHYGLGVRHQPPASSSNPEHSAATSAARELPTASLNE